MIKIQSYKPIQFIPKNIEQTSNIIKKNDIKLTYEEIRKILLAFCVPPCATLKRFIKLLRKEIVSQKDPDSVVSISSSFNV